MNTPERYELIDHGIDHAQYFQGCGVCFTHFHEVQTGCGENFGKAIQDALEAIACSTRGDLAKKLETQIKSDEGWKEWPESPEANADTPKEELEYSEMYYYVSIRYMDPALEDNKQ